MNSSLPFQHVSVYLIINLLHTLNYSFTCPICSLCLSYHDTDHVFQSFFNLNVTNRVQTSVWMIPSSNLFDK
jgi:hypothetical protein